MRFRSVSVKPGDGRSSELEVEPAPEVAIDDGAAERLAGAIRIATVSPEDSADFDAAAFQALHAYLQAAFPRVHSGLRRETVGAHSLLYTWQGTDPSVDPILRNPPPARLEGPTRQLFERVGPRFPLAQRAVFANLWATRPLVIGELEGSPTTNAMIRTTTAVTIFQAGTKDNVLVSRARAVVNFRILPGDSMAGVLDHVRSVIDDRRVDVRAVGAFSSEPSAVSSTESESFRTLECTIRSVGPETLVAPYLVVVVTDARHYRDLSSNVFRFMPVRLAAADLAHVHGADERVAVRDYERAIRLYRQLILTTAGE